MAEEVEMTPVAAEPPKANPLAKPAAPLGGGTLRLNPVARPAAAKPGAAAGLRSGLKLPPKPAIGASALKPGLKLPAKPGATINALRPGLKLPTKPVIRKPGAAAAPSPLPRPVVPSPAAAKPGAAVPPPAGQTAAAAAESKPLEQLKTVTQKLKGITQQIPQQAILHKTGIIADTAMTDIQKEAAKHRTARISLSDAMGVAPIKEEHVPMKTIRIKRPVDIASPTTSSAPIAPSATPAPPRPAAAPAPAAPAAAAPSATAPATASASAPAPAPAATPAATPPAATLTQRKTLRIARPGGAVRPTGKFAARRPAPVAGDSAAAASASDGVADIPEMPAAPVAAMPEPDAGPAWLWTLSTLVQMAACVAIGALAWFLYQNTTIQYF